MRLNMKSIVPGLLGLSLACTMMVGCSENKVKQEEQSSTASLPSSLVATSAAAAEGEITFTVDVIHADGTTSTFTLHSDAENLADALLEEGLVKGDEGQYGLFVTEVDGEQASGSGWWKLLINGEEAQVGASSVPLEDDAQYTWQYEK